MTKPATSVTIPQAAYPSTFSAELTEHCRQGCIPPEVFADVRPLLQPENRRRYVRVNPRCLELVLEAGVEVVLRLEALAALPAEKSSLSADEQQVRCNIQTYLTRVSSPETKVREALRKEHVRVLVPNSILLSLGIAGITGLPYAVVKAVPWLPCGAFTLPWSYSMGSSLVFREGILIAMDAASIAAVVALRPQKGERVLDLCCAPGMKLGLIADAIATGKHVDGAPREEVGLAVGVDVNLSRLYMTRSTLKKQQRGTGTRNASHSATLSSASPAVLAVDVPSQTLSSLPVCVFVSDGRTFSMADAAACMDSSSDAAVDVGTGLTARERRTLQRWPASCAKRARPNSAPASTITARTAPPDDKCSTSKDTHVVYAPTQARASLSTWKDLQRQQGKSNKATTWLFDRVLVDAECSHDGSVSHVQLEGEDTTLAPPSTHNSAIEKGRGLTNEYRMQHLNLGASDSGRSAAALNFSSCSFTGVPYGIVSTSNDSSLFDLQSELLYNGYQQLKPGGTLVYSTCSYAFTQDELVVRRFLDRVNTPAEQTKCGVKVTAVVVPAFSYAHDVPVVVNDTDGTDSTSVAPCVCIESEAAARALQDLLDAHALDYGVLERGMCRYLPQDEQLPSSAQLGSRFWPRTFSCSFLFVAKIWKKVDGVEAKPEESKEEHW